MHACLTRRLGGAFGLPVASPPAGGRALNTLQPFTHTARGRVPTRHATRPATRAIRTAALLAWFVSRFNTAYRTPLLLPFRQPPAISAWSLDISPSARSVNLFVLPRTRACGSRRHAFVSPVVLVLSVILGSAYSTYLSYRSFRSRIHLTPLYLFYAINRARRY